MPPKKTKTKLHQLATELPQNSIVSDISSKKQYCIGRQFASGGFGRIYTCNEKGSKKELAIKVEPYDNGPLFMETHVFLRILKQEQIEEFLRRKNLNRVGVPPLISFGIHQHGDEKLRFLVMPKYAISLESILEKSKTLAAFDVWTVARCILGSLEYIHEKNYTHADIKAANILLERRNDFSSCVLVDYGLAHRSSDNEDRPDKKRAHNGTALFTSCDAHRGSHPSYRGDLEILGYNIMYWLTGSLPWQKYGSKPSEVHRLKEIFLSDLLSNLKNQLKENTDCIPPLNEIFTIVRKSDYSTQLHFSELFKIVDNALKKSRDSGRKRGSEEPLGEILEVNVKQTMKRKKFAPQRSCPNDETPRGMEPTVPRLIKNEAKLKASSSSSSNVGSKNSQQLPRPSKKLASLTPHMKSSSASQTQGKRKNCQGCSVEHSPTASKMYSSSRRAPYSATNSKSADHVNNDAGSTPLEKTVKVPAGKVSSEIKRSPNKLRKIPGMKNFRRGRNSIVIDQISRKHQKKTQD
ncbi:hypothetical protein KIN20_006488 [Parelaphostrongylus tenuis]|uniref:non-specific serine/threonine protein kinase n=1 Tax=Parelaphostrongylus tenuis TaxID=148309 RepID=A0AAD5QIC6_PARTN|nr:hypothetical protein KIN20_006488 [Parelaphostrongylus tenuis]